MDLTFVGWIIVGLAAGLISGVIIGGREMKGWMPSLVIGLISGVIAGWVAQALGWGSINSVWVAALFATVAAIVIRLIIRTLSFSDD